MENKRFYNQRASWWAEHKINSFWHEKQFRLFVPYFHTRDTIIDLGCAHGIHVPLFIGIGRALRYEGLDVSCRLLHIASRRYPQTRFHQGDLMDAESLPRKKYAGFWASAVLMHMREQEWPQLFANIERMIRPGGIGYFTLPRRRPNPASKKDFRLFSLWTPHKVRAFLKARRWEIVRWGNQRGYGDSWFWMIVRLPGSPGISAPCSA